MVIIPMMIAAMIEGQKHAQATKDPIPHIWRQSAVMAGIALAVNAVLGVIYVLVDPAAKTMVIDAPIIIPVAFFVLGLVFWLVARGFFGMGANTTWKALANGK